MKTKLILFGILAAMLLAGCNESPETVQYTVSLADSANGSVSAAVDGQPATQAAIGTTVTITATPNEGYEFVKWVVTGATPASVTAGTTTFTMPEGDVIIAAEFAEDVPAEEYDINVTPPANGSVSVTVNDQPVTQATAGTEITITATPDEECYFVKWIIEGTVPANEAARSTTFIMPESDVTITAAITEAEQYDIDVTAPPNGNSVSVTVDGLPVTRAVAGTEITLTATSNEGYGFVKWVIDGANPAGKTDETTTFEMPEGNVTIAAEFAAVFDITAIHSDKGSVLVIADGKENATQAATGTEITIIAIANEGYGFEKWTVMGATLNSAAQATTFTMPEDAVTIEAGFIFIPEGGVLINGVVWATCNVDAPGTFATTPESAGMLYQWGRNIGWSSTDPLVNSDGGTIWDTTGYGDSREWLTENDPSPEGWQVPSNDDYLKLCDDSKVSRRWSDSPAGYIFTDIASGNSIFLPATAVRGYSDGTLSPSGVGGFYWLDHAYGANISCYCISFNRTYFYGKQSSSGQSGYSVRPVAIMK